MGIYTVGIESLLEPSGRLRNCTFWHVHVGLVFQNPAVSPYSHLIHQEKTKTKTWSHLFHYIILRAKHFFFAAHMVLSKKSLWWNGNTLWWGWTVTCTNIKYSLRNLRTGSRLMASVPLARRGEARRVARLRPLAKLLVWSAFFTTVILASVGSRLVREVCLSHERFPRPLPVVSAALYD